jgi:hypothetical protein
MIEGVATAVLASLVSMLGCSDDPAAIPVDGGDAGFECSGATVCDGLMVRACDNHVKGATIVDCTSEGACSEGRCLSPACAAVEHDRSSLAGCRFYTVQADNVASDANAYTSFLITNPATEPAMISLEHFVLGSWDVEVPLTSVPAGASLRVPVSGLQVTQVGRQDGGLRLSSDRPVTVAQIESDDVNRDAKSSGGTMLLPAHVLGTHHMALTYRQVQTPELAALAGSPSGAGRLLIVGTQPSTTVTVKLSGTATGVVAGSEAWLNGGTQFDLDEGDVYQMWTANPEDDLSGTEIMSSQPIAVFSGNITTTYGVTADKLHSPDMAHEQMPPIDAWSNVYVAAQLLPQAGTCDTLLGEPGASLWRLMVWGKQTSTINAVDRLGQILTNERLESGQVLELTHAGDFVVTSTEPLLMTQGIDCEPSLSLAIAADTDRFVDDLTFAVLPSFEHVAAVARQSGVAVTFDGAPLEQLVKFTPVGGGFEVARLPIPTCPATAQVCTHRLQGRFGMTMRGMDIVASYALTVPGLGGCADYSDPRCPQ